MNSERYRRRYRQVMRNRFIFALILVLLFVVCIKFGMFICSGGEKSKKQSANSTVEDSKQTSSLSEDVSQTGNDELPSDNNKRIVCLDPGHGGNDGGAVGFDGSVEKDDTLIMALALKKALEDKGITVVMTRSEDVYVSLEKRVEMANSCNGALLISIHRNSYKTDASVQGFETWISSEADDKALSIANKLQEALVETGITKDRGVKYGSEASGNGDYYINENAEITSCLLEMGFMTNTEDNNIYRNNTKAFAQAMAEAIVSWMNEQGY